MDTADSIEGHADGSALEDVNENLAAFQEIRTDNGPPPRSGHRIFITADHLYVIGGYYRPPDDTRAAKVYHDIWCMNLVSHLWTQLKVHDGFPKALASFAISQFAPFSDEVLLFGGTDLPFGVGASSETYILTVSAFDGECTSRKVADERSIGRLYGHALVRNDVFLGEEPEFYAIGGTTGNQFFLDVHRLHKYGEQWVWTNEAREVDGELGLYRLEVVPDKNRLVMFGGGTPDRVKNFEELTIFDLASKEYSSIATTPDKIHGFPAPRRCHSITQWHRNIFIVGGCTEDMLDEEGTHVEIYADVWMFNLDSFNWSKYAHSLKYPVFFHDAAISQDGCLYIFGGVLDQRSQYRCNILQAMWLAPPSLKNIASRKVFEQKPFSDGPKLCDFLLSDPTPTINNINGSTGRKEM